MIDFLKSVDTRLFLLFNGHHTPFMDKVMSLAGGKLTWIPLYILLLFFVWRKKQEKMWLVVLSVAILITFSDQISVHLFKETFQRYRPCHNLLLQGKVQLINGECGGLYGFVSNHAANSFALITFLSLFFRKVSIALCLYLWASFVCYGRVYAGVHYPFDIVGGMALGIFLGLVTYKLYKNLDKKYAQ
ncbi:MAG: phosphatase PAP2 family protein [Bacteroidetes bacterium]|nr:phosphatase PAP2 family protein [Bacteroidota bacterium]